MLSQFVFILKINIKQEFSEAFHDDALDVLYSDFTCAAVCPGAFSSVLYLTFEQT